MKCVWSNQVYAKASDEPMNLHWGHEISELSNRTDLRLHWDTSLTPVLEQNQSLINDYFSKSCDFEVTFLRCFFLFQPRSMPCFQHRPFFHTWKNYDLKKCIYFKSTWFEVMSQIVSKSAVSSMWGLIWAALDAHYGFDPTSHVQPHTRTHTWKHTSCSRLFAARWHFTP